MQKAGPKVTRSVAAPKSTVQGPQVVLSVELGADEDVEWNWTHATEGSYVSGYTLKNRKSILRVIGAGLPRTATFSLKEALEQLLGGRCCHMTTIPGYPYNLGKGWNHVLEGGTPDWHALFADYVAAVDWPASMFWHELSMANPKALVLLSVRDSAELWWQSANETILPLARRALAPGWNGGRDLVALLERFTGTERWDEPAILMAAYEQQNARVRKTIPHHRLLEWRASDGWAPICRALALPTPDMPFPWINRKSDWP